jgi:hypothetical protein
MIHQRSQIYAKGKIDIFVTVVSTVRKFLLKTDNIR